MSEQAFANPYGFTSEDFAPRGAIALSPEALTDAKEFVGHLQRFEPTSRWIAGFVWFPEFHARMSGNLHRRRMLKFVHADFRLIEYRQPPLKDQYDEWLARVICYAFSVPATPFVSQVNRATSETMRLQATQEGLVPLKNWVKSALDEVIQVSMGEPGLEFVWVGDDAIDPLQQAQTLNILVSAGIKTREEARAELGLGGEGKAGDATGLGKFNPYHDQQTGQFTTAADGQAGLADPLKPKLMLISL